VDILDNLLMWLHFIGLALGGVASFGLPVVGRQMAAAQPELRPGLAKVAGGLSTLGRAGFGVLIITGPILFSIKWSGAAPQMGWFIAKMVLVLLLLGAIIWAGVNANRALGGDMAAAKRQPMIGMVALALFVGIILCAVFAFD
jgi:uncharacterized membrane protein